jgi:2-oxoacid:acceptor oxidoreductase delta subunit (pyruvate/2-ketoisovalerate family)
LHHHSVAPCHGACPAGEDPQAYIALLDEGRPRKAWEELVRVNPLPAITGRVCHHPCETQCNRGQYDEPLAIHSIERYLGDQAIAHDWPYPVARPDAGAPRVAVVGAGPSGLAAAYHMIRTGYQVSLFAAVAEAGGTLRVIPGYRLPAQVIAAECERVLSVGIDFHPNQRLGRDIFLDELRAEFKAVYLAPGVQQGKDWSVEGVVPRDLHQGLSLLKEWMSLRSVPEMKSAAVVGGGNTAVDVARILRRAGVPQVHIVTHNGLPGPGAIPGDVMRAIPREIEQATEEGVQIHDHRGIRRLILRGEKVTGIEMTRMKKLRDKNGRLQRVAFEGTESILHVDQVIPAIGQVVNPGGMEALLDGDPFFSVDEWGQIPGQPGVFAGGDARERSEGTVTSAVGDGRRAAEAMAAWIKGQALPEPRVVEPIGYTGLNLEYFEPRPRAQARIMPIEERSCEEEIEGGLTSKQAANEAQRCFACGNCLLCDNCWTLCPDSAVLKTDETAEDGSHYVFDYDYCKGCGLCSNECPTGYIKMEPEP